ncbi:MAG: hypothetical protein J6Y10_00545 [Lachnospiraceae bacterium]|nr:hypothetical protein [Lachnospiraceae bacterium]
MENNNQSGEQVQANRQAVLGKILDWFRSAVLYAVLILVSEHFLKKDYSISGTWLEDAGTILFIALVAVYAAAVVFDIVMERKRYGKCRGTAVTATTPLKYLRDDFFRPFAEIIESLKCIFTFSEHTWGEMGISFVNFIAFAALVAAFVIFGLRLFFYIIFIGF